MNTSTTLYKGFKPFELPLLTPLERINFAPERTFAPKVFFGNPIPGLQVAPDFLEQIVLKASVVPKGTLIPAIDLSRLNHKATTTDIEAALKCDQLDMDEKILCVVLGRLITLQSKGKLKQSGNARKAYLLHTSDWVVVLRWRTNHDNRQDWCVRKHNRDSLNLDRGDLIFSPAA